MKMKKVTFFMAIDLVFNPLFIAQGLLFLINLLQQTVKVKEWR